MFSSLVSRASHEVEVAHAEPTAPVGPACRRGAANRMSLALLWLVALPDVGILKSQTMPASARVRWHIFGWEKDVRAHLPSTTAPAPVAPYSLAEVVPLVNLFYRIEVDEC